MRSAHYFCRALVLAIGLAVTASAALGNPDATAPRVEDFFRSATATEATSGTTEASVCYA